MRENFSKSTVRTIANRAGNQCSYPSCRMRLVGPDSNSDGFLHTGYAAHIYSASPKGPRGQGGLKRQELSHHENGIWLCGQHARVVDANGGIGHSAEKLFHYKRLHEHRVQKEIQGVCPIIGWIHELKITRSPIFDPSAKIRLGKLNLLFGDNHTGKTAVGQYLGGVFDSKLLRRWNSSGKFDLAFDIEYYNPEAMHIKFSESHKIPKRYDFAGVTSSRNLVTVNAITVPELDSSLDKNTNDKRFISKALDLPIWEIESLLPLINAFPHTNMRNYHFEGEAESAHLVVELPKSRARREFQYLSTTEQKLVLVDIASAAARQSSKITPTILIVDCNFIASDELLGQLENQFLAVDNNFQSILTFRLDSIDLREVRWRGWEVIRLYRETDGALTKFSQDPKMKIEAEEWWKSIKT